jgi:hypothetical protein
MRILYGQTDILSAGQRMNRLKGQRESAQPPLPPDGRLRCPHGEALSRWAQADRYSQYSRLGRDNLSSSSSAGSRGGSRKPGDPGENIIADPDPTPVPRDSLPVNSQEPKIAPDPQKLHDRAAESAKETRQSVLTLSSGALAVFFLALTTDKAVEPALKPFERWVILLSLTCMAVAVVSSLWCAYADAQWSYWWARAIEKRHEDAERYKDIEGLQDSYHGHKRVSETVLRWAFAVGVTLAAVYLFSRIYSLTPAAPSHAPQRTALHDCVN